MLIPDPNFEVLSKLCGAADRTRTYDPIITNDVLYQLSYSGILGPTMALLVLLLCLELLGFASHSSGDPLITNDVLYQLSYSGVRQVFIILPQPCVGLFFHHVKGGRL